MRQNQFIFMFFDSFVAVKAILQGILETKNFKGEALVVYHTSKYTGTYDTGVLASEKVGFAIYVYIYIYIYTYILYIYMYTQYTDSFPDPDSR